MWIQKLSCTEQDGGLVICSLCYLSNISICIDIVGQKKKWIFSMLCAQVNSGVITIFILNQLICQYNLCHNEMCCQNHGPVSLNEQTLMVTCKQSFRLKEINDCLFEVK